MRLCSFSSIRHQDGHSQRFFNLTFVMPLPSLPSPQVHDWLSHLYLAMNHSVIWAHHHGSRDTAGQGQPPPRFNLVSTSLEVNSLIAIHESG